MGNEAVPNHIRQRSPGFPSISVVSAVEQIEKIYAKERRNAIPREVAVRHLGYTSVNGASATVLSALSQYGLTDDAGSGRLRVTELGEAILHPRSNEEKTELLSEIAKQPVMFQRLLSRYPHHVPSDETLRADLIRDYQFKPNAVSTFLRVFRASLAITSDGGPASSETSTDDTAQWARYDTAALSLSKAPSVQEFRDAATSDDHRLDSPLTSETHVELVVHGPLSPDSVARLKIWLEKVAIPWAEFRAASASSEALG